MQAFDMEAAKNGAKVVTRDGRKVRILCFDLNNGGKPIVAAISNKDGYEFETTFFPDGRLVKRQDLKRKNHEAEIITEDRPEDLFMAE